MRVIAGHARGVILESPKEQSQTRPTIDRVKESLFSAIQFFVPGALVLDLFAGSGQLGIEALSRDAKECIFVESCDEACKLIKKNLIKTNLLEKSQIYHQIAFDFLKQCTQKFDLILLDPPYGKNIFYDLLPELERVTMPGGIIMVETECGAEIPSEYQTLKLKKTYHYGKVALARYEKEGEIYDN